MLLNLSEDQEFFRETTDRFLNELVPPDAVRALRHDETGFDRTYWRRGAELGWTSLLVSEEHGGGTISGAGTGRPQPRRLRLRAARRARTARRRPTWWRRRSARTAPHPTCWLPCCRARGSPRGAPRCRARTDGGRRSTRAHDGTDLVLRGEARPVEAAGAAGHLLVTCDAGDGTTTQVLVPTSAEGITVSPMQTVDLSRRFSRVTFDDVRVPGDAVVGAAGPGGARRGSSIPGAAQRPQRRVRRGHAERVRHDGRVGLRPLLLRPTPGLVPGPEAPVRRHDELARGIARHQRGRLRRRPRTGSDDAPELVSAAKAYIGQYGAELLQDCVQLHGGIGVTFEHDLHLYLRRAHRRQRAGREAGGPPPAHRRHGDRAGAGGAAA